MKIRTDFVTNSSSSNFTVELEIFTADGVIRYLNTGADEDGTELIFTASPKQLGTCATVKELIDMIRSNSEEGCGFWDNEAITEFEDKDNPLVCSEEQFFDKLSKLKDMDEIRQIIVAGWEERPSAKHEMTYIYDRGSGKYTAEFRGHENPNGVAGSLSFSDEAECEITEEE